MERHQLTEVLGKSPAPYAGVRAVFFDVDNTLVGDWTPDIPSGRFLKAAAAARGRLDIGLITSRPLPMVAHILDAARLSGLSVLSNGTQIADGHKIIREEIIPPVACARLMSQLSTIVPDVWVNDDGTDYFVPDSAGGLYKRRADLWDAHGSEVPDPKYVPTRPLVIVAHGADIASAAAINRLVQKTYGLDLTAKIARQYLSSGKTRYDVFVTRRGAGKADALKRILQIRGLSRQQIMFVGDGRNDVEIIRLAGIGVALANAAPLAKRAADYLAPAWDQDGAAVALESVLKEST